MLNKQFKYLSSSNLITPVIEDRDGFLQHSEENPHLSWWSVIVNNIIFVYLRIGIIHYKNGKLSDLSGNQFVSIWILWINKNPASSGHRSTRSVYVFEVHTEYYQVDFYDKTIQTVHCLEYSFVIFLLKVPIHRKKMLLHICHWTRNIFKCKCLLSYLLNIIRYM